MIVSILREEMSERQGIDTEAAGTSAGASLLIGAYVKMKLLSHLSDSFNSGEIYHENNLK